MKQKTEWKLAAGILLLLLCLLCAGCADKNDTKADEPQVYITFGAGRTTNEWQVEYSAISRDGEIILPLEQQQMTVISDKKTGEQLWLQTREQYVDDPALTAEELYEDNNWEHIHSIYRLYDLKGNLLQDMGERAVWNVYGDWVLYNDGKLESRESGAVLFDDVDSFYVDGNYVVMHCQNYNKVRVADNNLQVLWELDGNSYDYNAGKPIKYRRDDKLGAIALDGTEVLPCQYDYIRCEEYSNNCIVEQDGKTAVVSLLNGSVLYEETEQDKEIYYADDAVLLLRTWKTDANGERDMQVQMYNYHGEPISDVYQYIYQESDLLLAGQNYLFSAGSLDGTPVLLNEQGQEVYRGVVGTWLNTVTADRVIITDNNKIKNAAVLQTLDGKVLNPKEYDGMYPVYISSKNGEFSQKAPLVIANYNFGNTVLLDLLDADGNLLIEQAKSIQALDYDRFWVEKGFSQGLMDQEGNWLYEQSLFDTTVDE